MQVSEGKWSLSEEDIIDLTPDNELQKQIKNIHGAEKYKKIQEYILSALGQKIRLSDGKVAIVDRSDALHIANKSGTDKTAQISRIKKLVEKAKLFAEDKNVEHNKFKYFCYYQSFVKYKNEIFPLYLNVGLGINDSKYHLYDVTKKIRDTANRINGLERPIPNEGYALENGISDIIIPDSAKKSNPLEEKSLKNKKFSLSDASYLDAVNRGDMETAQAMVDEAARAAGYKNMYYHGAKNGGGFTVFRDWSYFTENKDYAQRYAKRDADGALYTTFVKLGHPFDTRKATDRKIFETIRNEYGLSEIQDSGLPD